MAVGLVPDIDLGHPEAPIDPRLDAKRLLAEALDHFSRSQQYVQTFWDRWLRYYRMYRSQPSLKSRPWRANVFVPIAFAQVEHGLAMIMDAWFPTPTRPFISVVPREGQDYERAKIVEAYHEWELGDIPAYLPLYDTNKEMLIYGTGWCKVYWDWTADRNTIENVSVWNLYPDPAAEDIDDAEFIIQRSLRPASAIRRLIRQGVYDLDEAAVDAMAREGVGFLEQDVVLLNRQQTTTLFEGRIEVLEEWREDPEPMVVTILNRRHVVRARGNPFPHRRKPFVRWVDHPLPHELYGVGEIEVLEKLIEEINDIRNQRLDVVSLLINNVLVASTSAGIDPTTLVMRPGQVIWTNDVNAIRPLLQGGNPALGVNEEQIARFDVQEATGNWGYNQGQVPTRREAATTVLALQRAAGLRFTAKVRWNEEAAAKRLASLMVRNAQEFAPPERWVRITGRPLPQRVSREDLQGTWDFILAASTAEPREAKRARVAQLLPVLLRHPRVNDAALLEWVFDLFGIREKEHLVLSDAEMAARQATMAMATGQGLPGIASPDLGAPAPGSLPSLEGIAQASALREQMDEFLGGGG
jgi:hypothetical protein